MLRFYKHIMLALVSKVLLFENTAENERFRVLLRLIKEPPRLVFVFERITGSDGENA